MTDNDDLEAAIVRWDALMRELARGPEGDHELPPLTGNAPDEYVAWSMAAVRCDDAGDEASGDRIRDEILDPLWERMTEDERVNVAAELAVLMATDRSRA